MFEISYIARPLIGAVIGYITNDIAIRMLFRPRTAKYLFGVRLPFTPGLIPKEKARIASSIGEAISKNLMNREVLEKTLLSDDITAKLGSAFDSFVAAQKTNPEPVESFLHRYMEGADLDTLCANVSAGLSEQIHKSLISAALGPKIASLAVEHVLAKVRGGMLGRLGADQVLALLASPLEKLLAKNITEMIENDSRQMAGTLIDNQLDSFMARPMMELFTGHDEQINRLRRWLLSMYRRLVSEQLPKALETVNISSMIEQRINEMDVRETERLILQVMRKELKAIVWLGALLGFVMGCVNLLF